MVQAILSILSVILFCICCRQLILAILKPIPVLVTERPYSLGAMKIGKFYAVMSWTVMTSVFMFAVGISFYQVFSSL
jgi:hypothetical protein